MSKPIPFGKYYLLDRINAGGMAEVFRAKAFGVEGFERIVAVKRILPTIAADTDFITMFIDEAKIAVQLNHSNIAQIFDLGKVGESYFIALEYVHGIDVRAIFDRLAQRRERMPVAMAGYIVMKICEGLDYAHNKCDPSGRPLELVHRDVSPQNMLISFDGDVKLIDFGIAKAATKEGRTRAGILKGKFGYLSPEQIRGGLVLPRSDVWGVGIVLHELLTGQRLFVGDTEFSTIEKVRSAEIPPPDSINPNVTEELADVVMTALQRDPERRYQSALDLQEDLQRLLREQYEPFTRRELSAFLREYFPEHAADDQEAVGDLHGVDVPNADETDVTPIVEPTESKAVIDETRDIPAEGSSSKHSSTLLGMPVVARPAPGRSVPPPPPRGGSGAASATQQGIGRVHSVPPPPPTAPQARSVPPAPQARSVPPAPPSPASRPPALPSSSAPASYPAATPPSYAPVSSGATPQVRSQPAGIDTARSSIPSVASPSGPPPSARTLPPPPGAGGGLASMYSGTPVAPAAGNPVLDMDWDEEELSTQVYDRPEDQVEGGPGYDDYPNSGYEEYASPYGGQAAVATFVSPPVEQLPSGYGVPVPAYVPSSAALPGSPSQARATQPVFTHTPPEKSRSLFYAMAVAALVFVSFLGYVFLSKTEPGVVQLTTHPADATVTFDGKPVGSSSPFLVTSVAPGEKHVLEVRKDGYRSWSQEVQVQPGQALQFPVTLEPTSGGPGPAVAEPETAGGTGTFTLETTPPGAKVFLDGQELRGVTPVRIGNLLAKRYSLKLQLADYRELTVPVDVKPGQDLALPRVVLQPERVHVRIVSEPSGAEVSVARGAERRTLGRAPVDVTLDNVGEPWTVEVNKAGFKLFTQPVDTSTGQSEIAVKANLARAGGVAVAAPPAAVREPTIPREPREPKEPKISKPKPEPVASSGGGNGTLRINSRPWSQVVIDGRSVGSTPQMNLSLSEGTHKIMLVNPEFDIKKTLTVTIKAGQVETQIVTLQ